MTIRQILYASDLGEDWYGKKCCSFHGSRALKSLIRQSDKNT